jgi:hypothetical protein
MAYEQVTTTHRVTFQDNMEMALSILTNPFEPYMTFNSNLKGKSAMVIEYIGPVEPIIDGSRGGDTPNAEFTHEQVWCRPRQIEQGTTIEKEDTIKRTISLESVYTKGLALAIMRGRRRIMREAIFGPRITGEDAAQVTTPFTPTAGVNLVAKDFVRSGAATNSGLTFDKIIKARTLLTGSEVDPVDERLAMAITGQQEFDLYGQVQFLSKDFRERAVIDDNQKRVIAFADIDFLRVNELPEAAAKERRCPLWCVSAIQYGDFSPLETNVERDSSKKYRLRPYAENWFGATRTEDRKVIDIRCVEP